MRCALVLPADEDSLDAGKLASQGGADGLGLREGARIGQRNKFIDPGFFRYAAEEQSLRQKVFRQQLVLLLGQAAGRNDGIKEAVPRGHFAQSLRVHISVSNPDRRVGSQAIDHVQGFRRLRQQDGHQARNLVHPRSEENLFGRPRSGDPEKAPRSRRALEADGAEGRDEEVLHLAFDPRLRERKSSGGNLGQLWQEFLDVMRAVEDFREVQADPADKGKARGFFRKVGDQSLPDLASGWHLGICDAGPRPWLFARPEETVLDQDGGQAPEIVLHAGGDTPSRNALR